MFRMTLVSANDAVKPITTPLTASFSPCRRIMRNTLLDTGFTLGQGLELGRHWRCWDFTD
jgi:hypothetical protein